ncbi:MAG: DNA-binding protein [Bacteroidetes bacterium HGW-Bacteroidetes-21]|jgi:hypothetical protein|nr:MAG: DNA-binding protein [Bacteroidetes bacterium HGW-Bacteroidetes-21]
MSEDHQITKIDKIKNHIITVRNVQVILDSDLAEMYGVSTSRLNEQVKRNIERFPEDFMFQLSKKEWGLLISQFATSKWGGRRKLPYVFTEQGIASLSGVLNSKTAIKVNIGIMRAFVEMRKFLTQNAAIFQKLEKIEQSYLIFKNETNSKFEIVFNELDKQKLTPEQGIFFDGQIFDAYTFVSDLIKSAKNNIVLIDNYIDESVLLLLTKRKNKVKATIYTAKLSKQNLLDIEKHNQQYPSIEINVFTKSHDRFLIIDNTNVYHIGASLKDLGKKWFAFSKINIDPKELLKKLESK